MIFNSVQFLFFFIIVVAIHFVLPHKLRWIFLLISSYIFYMAWNPTLIILILFSTFVNYYFALKIFNSNNKSKKYLIISMVINFSLLFIFKYLVLAGETLNNIFMWARLNYTINEFNIILPMGISFYTFQAASYTIDVYRKRIAPEKNYFKLSLFITFFPQLVAGPIERTDSLMPQLFKRKKFNLDKALLGSKIMLLGFFKKVVIADRVAIIVNTIYNSPQNYAGLHFFIATILFAFQIYCDFSGYSDIAIGCSKILGIDLCDNFNRPYFSKSIREFWHRWHISLSSWFKDYLYIPLGGSRVSKVRHYFNIFLTFLVSGLWHGANWTFVLWGAIHGICQIIEYIFISACKNIGKNMPKITTRTSNIAWRYTIKPLLNIMFTIITFSLVCLGWIFFRANTIGDSFYIISQIFTNTIINSQYIYDVVNDLGVLLIEFILIVISIFVLIIIELISFKTSIHKLLDKQTFIIRWSFYYLIIILIIALGVYHSASQFIYFQF